MSATELGPPRCGVYGCESYAPAEYTDGTGKRCLDCFDTDRDLGEVPTPDRSVDRDTDQEATSR
jgi:hypothetical protein